MAARITAAIRRAVNRDLKPVNSPPYHESIPLDTIFAALRKHGLIPVQEDGTPWQGLLCGADSHTTFDLKHGDQPIVNAALYLAWYRMDATGHYEIVTYLS